MTAVQHHSTLVPERSGQRTLDFLIYAAHDHFSLRAERRQILVLLEFHRRRNLIFGCSTPDFVLDCVSCICQDLAHMVQLGSSLPWIIGNGTVPWNKEIGAKCPDRIEY